MLGLLLSNEVGVGSTIVAALRLAGLEVGTHEVGLITTATDTKASNSNAVQRVEVVADRAGLLDLLLNGSTAAHAETKVVARLLVQVDVGGELRNLDLGVHHALVKGHDVTAKSVVVILHLGEVLLVGVNQLDLVLKLADVGLLALAESTLFHMSILCTR